MSDVIKIRKFSFLTYLLVFALSIIALFNVNNVSFSVFGVQFSCNKITTVLLFAMNFCCFIYGAILKKAAKTLLLLILLLANLLFICDNIFVFLISIFILFLLRYLQCGQKNTLYSDCIIIFFSFALMSYGLVRYFFLQEIDLSFSNIALYADKIEYNALLASFLAFFIIICRFFNILPFNIKKTDLHSFVFLKIIYYTLGCSLLIKIYTIYNEILFEFQDYIILYLLANIIYYGVIQFKSSSIYDFLDTTFPVNVSIGILNIFAFSQNGIISFVYCALVLLCTYTSGFILCDITERKFGGSEFNLLKKASHTDILFKFFVFVIFLNFAKLPPFICFSAFIYSTINVFLAGIQAYGVSVASYVAYIFTFLISINSLSIIDRMLISPVVSIKSFNLTLRQKSVLFVICFIILFGGAGLGYMINQFVNSVKVGNI